jgi:hypothetical protein
MNLQPVILSFSICLFSFFNFFAIENVYSQDDLFIKGKIFNQENHEVIPFATILLKQNKIGIISNSNGDFRLGIQPGFQADSVIISSIGFQRKALAYNSLESSKVNNIYLVPAVYKINEVTIVAKKKKLKAEQIIGLAIQNIKNNYSHAPFNYTAYYRDYQKYSGKIFNLNEAIIYTEDNGFNQNLLLNRFRLLDFKKNPNFPTMQIPSHYDTITSINGSMLKKVIPHSYLFDETGNELVILLVHDAIRNYNIRSFSFVNNFSEDFIPNHIFKKPKIVLYNNLPLYEINFKLRPVVKGENYDELGAFELRPKVKVDNYDVKGTIYIQPDNYAIYKFDYSCFYVNSINEKKILFNISTEYDYENSTDSPMHLKYISFNNTFELTDPDTSSFFKVTDYYLNPKDPSNSTLTVEFNHTPEYYSVSDERNYTIFIDNEEIGIKKVVPFDKSVNIIFEESVTNTEEKTYVLDLKNIWDTSENLINKRKTFEMYQFRELFVQSYNNTLHFIDDNYLNPIPLEQNLKSIFTDNYDYWMNTPELNKAEKQK